MAAVVAAGEADLAVGRRVPQARAWPWHARAGNAVIAATLRRRGVPVHDLAPVRVASRAALLGLGVADRSFGYPLELLLRAGAAGWRIREVPVPYRRPGRRPVEGLGLAARHGPGGPGHGGAAAVREPERVLRINAAVEQSRGHGPTLALLVLAKAPEAGRVKTRLCPPLTLEEAADLAAAALLDTLGAVRAVHGGRVVVALAGRLSAAARAAELAAELRGVATRHQRGPDLGHRIAAAHRDAACLLPGRPVLQLGMDTPQVEPALLTEAAGPLRRGTVDAVARPGRRRRLVGAGAAGPAGRGGDRRRTDLARRHGGADRRTRYGPRGCGWACCRSSPTSTRPPTRRSSRGSRRDPVRGGRRRAAGPVRRPVVPVGSAWC